MESSNTKVDRQTTTPFHLKLFYKTGGAFHRSEDFTEHQNLPEHVQIYTWQSCSLRELGHLLVSALPNLLPYPAVGTRLSFRLIFPDTRNSASGTGRYMTKDLGSVIVGDGTQGSFPNEEQSSIVAEGVMSGGLGGEPEKTLQDAKFVIGDYVTCAITAPSADGSVAPPPSTRPAFGNGRGGGDFGRGPTGPRENGFGGFRGGSRGGLRGGGNFGQVNVPFGEWRRGERLPEGGGSRGRGGYGAGGGGGGFGGGRGGGGGGGRW